MVQPFVRPSWCRAKVLTVLEDLGRPVGLDEIRRRAKIRVEAVVHALYQLEIRDIVIRERNPQRQGFLWRIR